MNLRSNARRRDRALFQGFFLTAFVLVVSLALGAPRAFGQTYSASLTGVVTDPHGAVIPSAQVELRNEATGETRATQTEADGRYTLALLKPATYTLTVTMSGFQTYTQTGLTLEAQISSSIDVVMKIGTASEKVTVIGAAPLLDTESATQQATINSTLLTELPSGVQSPLPLVLGLAGTTTLGMSGQGNNLSDQTMDQQFSRFAIAGGRDMGNQILLDGSPDTAPDWGGLLVSPSNSSTQEMQVIRNTFDAQYGRTGGGVVNLITKGGTSQFHGEAYGYLRNDNLDAAPWGNNTFTQCDPSLTTRQCNDQKRPEFKREEFGATVGGPLWESKHLYFMASYDGLRVPGVGAWGPITVPTSRELTGDFSQSYNSDGTIQVLYNPFSTGGSPGFARTTFDPAGCAGVVYPATCPGNVIPANLMNSVGQKIAALFPKATSAGEPEFHTNNFFALGSSETVSDHVDGRVDWAHNEKHSMYFRWSERLRDKAPVPDFFGTGATPTQEEADTGFHGVLGNTFTPNPTTVINVLIASGRWNENHTPVAPGKVTPTTLGFNPADFQGQFAPPFSIQGYTGLGSGAIQDYIRNENTLQVDVSKQKGAHAIKFGAYLESSMINFINENTGPQPYAAYSFGRNSTGGANGSTPDPDTGNGLASLLMGVGNGGGPTVFQPDLAVGMPYYGFYAQDTWKATPKLTLTLGLRYELQPGATERHNRWSLLDLNATNPLAAITGLPLKGDFVYATPGNRGLWETNYKDFAPRIGLAYQITPKLVMRAGFGMFYMPSQSLIESDSPSNVIGFSTSTPWLATSPSNPYLPLNLISNPYPNGLTQATGRNTSFLATTGQGLFQVWLKGQKAVPYKQDWSLDFQYEFSPASVLEVGYSGFGARKLLYGNPGLNPDQLPDQFIGPAQNDQVANPFAAAVAQYPSLGNTFMAGGPCPATINAPSCVTNYNLEVPYPAYSYFIVTRSFPGATENFNSLWVKYSHRFSGGLTLLSTYQWSKALDDASEDQGWEVGNSSPWRDYYNRKAEYSVSAHDVPQSFVTSFVYDLPFGHGKHFGTGISGVANAIAGGWQTSSIIRLTSGFPLSVSAPWPYAGAHGYPDLVSTKLVNTKKTPIPGGGVRWFNSCSQLTNGSLSNCLPGDPTAWIQAGAFAFGNAPRNISNLRTDWFRNVDFGLAKNFRATERVRVQFRADAFNLFNTPVLGNYTDTGLTDGGFGNSYGTMNSSREIQLGLRVFF